MSTFREEVSKNKANFFFTMGGVALAGLGFALLSVPVILVGAALIVVGMLAA